jgi:hypothetical protein
LTSPVGSIAALSGVIAGYLVANGLQIGNGMVGARNRRRRRD